jgi:serine/threonine protein kinase
MAKDTSTLSLPKTRRVGTIAYMAPEIVDSTGVYDGAPVDVWSLGVMLYVMVYCNYPFGHDGAGGESTRKVLERIRGAQVRTRAKLAQKLGRLQPFTAVFAQEGMGQLAPFGPT